MYPTILLSAVLLAAPVFCAAYDYDALPKPAPAKEKPITYEEAFPDLTGKSYTEIEDITSKLDRLAKQAKYREQQRKQAQQNAQPENAENMQKPTAKPSFSEIEDIDRKRDEAAKRKEAKEGKKTKTVTREVWSADPETGTHDWVGVTVEVPAEENAQNASADEFPQEQPDADEFPKEEFPQDAQTDEFPGK